MKIDMTEYFWGISLVKVIGKRRYIAYLEKGFPNIEILVGDATKKQSDFTLKPYWKVSWENLPIADCFDFVNEVPKIKVFRKNKVKRYFDNIIARLDKLGAFN